MKLKKIIRKKTIDLLIKDNEQAINIWNKDFDNMLSIDEDGNMHADESKLGYLLTKPMRKMKPYFEAMIAEEVLRYLRDHDTEYYNQVWNEINNKKGKAEINIKEIEEKVPNLKGLNEVFGFYS